MLMTCVASGTSSQVSGVISQTRTGKAFEHTLRIEPLRDCAGALRCLQASFSGIRYLDEPSCSLPRELDSARDELGLGRASPKWTRPEACDLTGFEVEPVIKSMGRKVSELSLSNLIELYDGAI